MTQTTGQDLPTRIYIDVNEKLWSPIHFEKRYDLMGKGKIFSFLLVSVSLELYELIKMIDYYYTIKNVKYDIILLIKPLNEFYAKNTLNEKAMLSLSHLRLFDQKVRFF